MTPPPANQTPPTIVPPTGPVQPKPKSTGLIIAALVGLGVLGGIGVAVLPKVAGNVVPSGMSTNGKSLSRAEAREGIKEIAELTRGARAGEPGTLNMAFEPKTELGKNFKAVAIKSADVEATYAKALGGKTVADLMDAKNLTTASARAATHKRLEDLKTASTKYFADTGEVSQELFRVIAGANGDRIPQAPALEAEISNNSRAMTKLLGTVGEVLDFADEAKPTMEGGTAAFQTQAQVSRYNSLIEKFNADSQAFQTAANAALQDRQRKMSESLRKIDSDAL